MGWAHNDPMNHHSRKTDYSDDDWKACPRGEMQRLSQKLKRRVRRRRILMAWAGALAGAAMVGGAVGWWFHSLLSREAPAPVDCIQVKALASAFTKGQLDSRQSEQIREHLVGCPACAAWVRNFIH